MPFQPINFAGIPLQEGFKIPDVVGKYMEGKTAVQQSRANELAEAFQKMKMQQYPEEERIAGALKESQTQKNLSDVEKQKQISQSPWGFLQNLAPDKAGQFQALALAQQSNDPEVKKFANNLQKSLFADLEKSQQLTNRYQLLNSTQNIRLLSPEAKKEREGYARALGIPPDELAKYPEKSIAQFAQEKGMALEDIRPIYAPTTPVIGEEQKRQANVAEVKKISELATPYLAQISKTIGKWSPELFDKMIQSGKLSDEESGKILASIAIQPELSAGRLRALGARVGKEGIEDVTEKMLADIKVPRWLVTPDMLLSMNATIEDWLGQGVNAYTDTLFARSKIKKQDEKKETVISSEDFFKTLGKKK